MAGDIGVITRSAFVNGLQLCDKIWAYSRGVRQGRYFNCGRWLCRLLVSYTKCRVY